MKGQDHLMSPQYSAYSVVSHTGNQQWSHAVEIAQLHATALISCVVYVWYV